MSDTLLQLVPTIPTFQPSTEAAMRAERLLRALLPRAESVRAEFKTSVVFFDPGENWSGVQCSLCGADSEAWWGEAMEAAHKTDFEQLDVVTKCCATKVSLNDLKYLWPAAFGKFVLEASNPNASNLGDEDVATLAECLGSELKQIWVRI